VKNLEFEQTLWNKRTAIAHSTRFSGVPALLAADFQLVAKLKGRADGRTVNEVVSELIE